MPDGSKRRFRPRRSRGEGAYGDFYANYYGLEQLDDGRHDRDRRGRRRASREQESATGGPLATRARAVARGVTAVLLNGVAAMVSVVRHPRRLVLPTIGAVVAGCVLFLILTVVPTGTGDDRSPVGGDPTGGPVVDGVVDPLQPILSGAPGQAITISPSAGVGAIGGGPGLGGDPANGGSAGGTTGGAGGTGSATAAGAQPGSGTSQTSAGGGSTSSSAPPTTQAPSDTPTPTQPPSSDTPTPTPSPSKTCALVNPFPPYNCLVPKLP